MSRINISFGTRMGYGEPLDEDAPFTSDKICEHCLAIFNKSFNDAPSSEDVLYIDSHHPNECRLCTLLISKLSTPETPPRLAIEYFVLPRYGYFIRVEDVMFHLLDTKLGSGKTVRLGMQMAKKNKDDGDHPRMVHFEPNISSSTNSEQSMAQAVAWFKECSENHEVCKETFPFSKFLPTRLVEISGHDEDALKIRLRESKTLPAEIQYATLSHCWGTTMPFKLQLETLDSCLESLPLDKLSQVFIDAIKFAWRMNLQYIWIDSLCIIQNSIQDWTAESSQMGFVYQHSTLNIAATGFSDGTNGLFVKRDPTLLTPIGFSIENKVVAKSSDPKPRVYRHDGLRAGEHYLVDTDTWREGVDEAPLCKRGWVAQERALSTRTIHFGTEQLYWECMQQNASEVYPNGFVGGTFSRDPKVFLTSGAKQNEKRMERLQTIRNDHMEDIKRDEEHRAWIREYKEKFGSFRGYSSDEVDSDDELSDRNFAKNMNALQLKGKPSAPAEEALESSDSDSESSYAHPENNKPFKIRKRFRHSIKGLYLAPENFEGCDLSILDGLDIKGWPKLKAKLQSWGFEDPSRVDPLPIRGMPFELRQWISVVQIFSRCSLTYSKDKLVAISGMAQSLGKQMHCDYLAGLWRRDLEHQLLWKVAGAFPAPKRDGTRGPSWSWASVDGAIVIPEWSGYFYGREPGDVTWFAKVDEASVQSVGTVRYGQARRGSVTMTGRLGVFRIEKEKLDQPPSGNGNIVPTKRWVAASWDTKEIEAVFGPSKTHIDLWRYSTYGTGKGGMNELDVFYLPVRVMDADPDEGDVEEPLLTGLLLLPVGKQKGVYRRVGQFELSNSWLRRGKETLDPLTEPTGIFDKNFFISKQKHGQYTVRII